MDDLTHCTICFEAYGDSEDRVPRLLPCTHTFCSACVERLIRNNTLVCPQDNQKYKALKGATSFPQNRYILRPVKENLNSIDEFETCERHNRLKMMYCKDVGCNRPICQLCMLQNHKTHDVEDIMEVIEEMRETATNTADLLSSNLQASYRKAAKDKREMQETIDFLVARLRDGAKANVNRFDTKISEIEEQIATINSISDSISLKSSFQEMRQKLKTLEEIRRTIHKTLRSNICFGSYGINRNDRYTEFTGERDAIWFSSKVETARTFEVNYQHTDGIKVLSNSTVVVTGEDNGEGYDYDPNSYWNWLRPFRQTYNRLREDKLNRLTQYKVSNGDVLFSKVTNISALSEATLNGKRCLVTFGRDCYGERFKNSLEYFDAEQLSSSLDREIEDLSWRWIAAPTNQDMNDIPVLPETLQDYLSGYQRTVRDMCCASEGTVKIFSVACNNSVKSVSAYSVKAKTLWSVRDFQPDGMNYEMNPYGITTDGRGHLFICDTANECIQIFDTDGTYLCPVDCNGKVDLGPPERIDWSETESALVVTHRGYKLCFNRGYRNCFISVLNVQIQPN